MAKVSPERPQGVRGEKMPIDGILVVDKPSGVTSHDIVDLIRGRFGFKKVGHAGTLDPLATGVLVILIGRATKLSNELLNREKEYEVSMVLGKRTDTGDADGKTIFEGKDYTGVTAAVMTAAMKKFTGSILQTPPMTSAVRHQGQKLYELARKGIEVERVARPVEIHELSLLSFAPPQVVLRAKCSKGTYVRVLCDDLGLELGCGAYVSGIKRIRS
ncbi:MAG: tRNA pseudouridine(55) synthase TruB, partial [Candidatus Omnitrophota bacterium]